MCYTKFGDFYDGNGLGLTVKYWSAHNQNIVKYFQDNWDKFKRGYVAVVEGKVKNNKGVLKNIKYNSLRECIFIDFYPNETQYAIENKIYDEIKSNIPKIQNKYQSELHYYYESPRYLTDLVIEYPEFASPIVENTELIGIHSEYTNRDYKI